MDSSYIDSQGVRAAALTSDSNKEPPQTTQCPLDQRMQTEAYRSTCAPLRIDSVSEVLRYMHTQAVTNALALAHHTMLKGSTYLRLIGWVLEVMGD